MTLPPKLAARRPRRERSPATVVECGHQSPRWPWGTGHPVPALNLPPGQPGGLPDSSRGPSAATTPGKLPQSPRTPAGCQQPAPAIGPCQLAIPRPQRQRRGPIPAWGHRPRNNAPVNRQGPTARPMVPPRTTAGRAAHPRPAAHILECGDQSPLWNSMTWHRVPKSCPRTPKRPAFPFSRFPLFPAGSAGAAHVNPRQHTDRGLENQKPIPFRYRKSNIALALT